MKGWIWYNGHAILDIVVPSYAERAGRRDSEGAGRLVECWWMEKQGCMKRIRAAVCGYYCGNCDTFLADACCGCGYTLGQTCQGECAVFRCCAVERGLEHCGLCLDFPCQVFLSHAPAPEVARRYRSLCRRAEIGTGAWLEEQELC